MMTVNPEKQTEVSGTRSMQSSQFPTFSSWAHDGGLIVFPPLYKYLNRVGGGASRGVSLKWQTQTTIYTENNGNSTDVRLIVSLFTLRSC